MACEGGVTVLTYAKKYAHNCVSSMLRWALIVNEVSYFQLTSPLDNQISDRASISLALGPCMHAYRMGQTD